MKYLRFVTGAMSDITLLNGKNKSANKEHH